MDHSCQENMAQAPYTLELRRRPNILGAIYRPIQEKKCDHPSIPIPDMEKLIPLLTQGYGISEGPITPDSGFVNNTSLQNTEERRSFIGVGRPNETCNTAKPKRITEKPVRYSNPECCTITTEESRVGGRLNGAVFKSSNSALNATDGVYEDNTTLSDEHSILPNIISIIHRQTCCSKNEAPTL